MKAEWKAYTGAPEQIAEIGNHKRDVLLRLSDNSETFVSKYFRTAWIALDIKEYLLCNPHPNADMICQQARTGQPVWVREPVIYTEDKSIREIANLVHRENVATLINAKGIFCQYCTNTPYWHIPDAEYSFTLFED